MSDAAIETPSQSTGEEEYDWDAADERALEALAAPIDPREIKVREGQGGRQLRYVQVPTVVRRLNEVLGRAGWGLEVEVYSNCMRCRLRITLPSGRVIARDGIGGYPERQGGRGISDEDLPKGAESDAMKRAAVKYGIAAELYEDAHEIPQGRGQYRGPGGPPRSQGPPLRPANGHAQPPARREPGDDAGGNYSEFRGQTGRHLFGWAKDNNCIDAINRIGKHWDLPGRMVDWTPEQVRQVHATLTGAQVGDPPDDDRPY